MRVFDTVELHQGLNTEEQQQDLDRHSTYTTRSSTLSDLYPVRGGPPATPTYYYDHVSDKIDKQQQSTSERHNQSTSSQDNISSSAPSRTLVQGSTSHHPHFSDNSTTTAAMNTSNAGGGYSHSRSSSPGAANTTTHSAPHRHFRQESGYQSSTIGTNSIPPMTIGVKRGEDLLASRRGPQITGNTYTPQTTTKGGGSAPPLHNIHNNNTSNNNAHHHANRSTGNISVQEIFDVAEFKQRAHEFDLAIARGTVPSVRPVYVGSATVAEAMNGTLDDATRLNYDDHDDESEEDRDEEDGNTTASEDDGIERAEGYHEEEEEEQHVLDERESSQLDKFGNITDNLPGDADPRVFNSNKVNSSNNNNAQRQQEQQQPFYQLQRGDEMEMGNSPPLSPGSEPRGQLLSTEALAARMLYGINPSTSQLFDEPPFRGHTTSPALLAHNEALRQHQQALREAASANGNANAASRNNAALLGVPKVKKVDSGTLGSPFNDGQLQSGAGGAGTQVAGLAATAAANAAAGVGPPISKKPVSKQRKNGGGTASTSAVNSEAGKGGRPENSKAKQAFPSSSKLDTSMNSSNTTLTGAGGSGSASRARNDLHSTSRNKKPPSSNNRYISGGAGGGGGNAGRNRKASDASERSVRKDDLLDRLADALKAERKLVKIYQEELRSAEDEITKVLAAEAVRDDEMARLEARHSRDKQLISALKLKVERLEVELMKAEDVPQHEAESYLDLLSGGGGIGGGILAGSASKKNRNKGYTEDSDEDYEDALDTSSRDEGGDDDDASEVNREDEERSMRDLVQEQDALDGTWTKKMMDKEDKRRKAFAKKRKQHLASMAANNSVSQDDQTEARLAEAQSMALAQAGLDQRPPLLASHTRKLSFKDTLKRTFGLKPLFDNDSRVTLTRFESAPTVSVVPASNASPVATTAKIKKPAPAPLAAPASFAPLTSANMMRTVSSPPPTMALPPIPIDPIVNAKDAKAQHKRLQKIADDEKRKNSNASLQPGMPDGTYGRSASMDVPRTPFYTPASVSETALPMLRTGYSSDSEAGNNVKKNGLAGLFKKDKPPPAANNTRYGAGIENNANARPARTRKLSWGRSGSNSVSGGNNGSGSGGGGSFFKHRK